VTAAEWWWLAAVIVGALSFVVTLAATTPQVERVARALVPIVAALVAAGLIALP
jgi:hypothetical protein